MAISKSFRSCHLPGPSTEQQFSIQEQLLRRNVKRFRGGLVSKAHRLVYHSTQSWRVVKKEESSCWCSFPTRGYPGEHNKGCVWNEDVQSAQRTAQSSKPYKPFQKDFILFAWKTSCGRPDVQARLRVESITTDAICTRLFRRTIFTKAPMAAKWLSSRSSSYTSKLGDI